MSKSDHYRWYVLVGHKVHEFDDAWEMRKFMAKRRNHFPLFQYELISAKYTPMNWVKRRRDNAYELQMLPYTTPVPKLILMHRLLSED